MLTVSTFLLLRAPFTDGLVTFPGGNVVCARVGSFFVLGFLGFLARTIGFGGSVGSFIESIPLPAKPTLSPCPAAPATCDGIPACLKPSFVLWIITPAWGGNTVVVGRSAPLDPLSPGSGNIEVRQTVVALVNVLCASLGMGIELVPERNSGFLRAVGTRSQMEGNSGEEDMTRTEASGAIVAIREKRRPFVFVAVACLRSRTPRLRPARPPRTEMILGKNNLKVKCSTELVVAYGRIPQEIERCSPNHGLQNDKQRPP